MPSKRRRYFSFPEVRVPSPRATRSFRSARIFSKYLIPDVDAAEHHEGEKGRRGLCGAVGRRDGLPQFVYLVPELAEPVGLREHRAHFLLVKLFPEVLFHEDGEVEELIDHVVDVALDGLLVGAADVAGAVEIRRQAPCTSGPGSGTTSSGYRK